jgi:beta-aspartyl-peptidase (threonine type)
VARGEACARAADEGRLLLGAGASALDAVQRAVEVLEDEPLLNAGTGGALTEDGTLELDAAIMEGAQLRAGAVCALPPFRHPITIARAVLEEGRHVLYAGEGAAGFARAAGFAPARPDEMITQAARAHLANVVARRVPPRDRGTVGAVARDGQGRLAAATSTGGITGQRPGRVGDSPILGAGTYADDAWGAISCTGHGEGFMRMTLAARVLAELQAGRAPDTAAMQALLALEQRLHMRGGIIVAAPDGTFGWARTAPHMPCAWAIDDRAVGLP